MALSLMNGMYTSPPSNTTPCLLQAVISKWNDQATLEARGRYSAEIARTQQAHASHCEAVQAQHDAVCLQIQQHNEAIWPQFTIAKAAQEELDRVGRFVEHIRWGPLLGSTENLTHNRKRTLLASVDWLLASLIRQLSVSGLSTHAFAPKQAASLYCIRPSRQPCSLHCNCMRHHQGFANMLACGGLPQ